MEDICVITLSKRPHCWRDAALNIVRQDSRPQVAVLGIHRCAGPLSLFTDPLLHTGIRVYAVELGHSSLAGTAMNDLRDCAARHSQSWTCVMDDDDYYGPDYLSGVLAEARDRPDALLLGHSAYTTHWIDGNCADEFYAGQVQPDGSAASLAGSTVCVRGDFWQSSEVRYPPIGLGCDGQFVNAFIERYGHVYHVRRGAFVYQRFSDPAHAHEWAR